MSGINPELLFRNYFRLCRQQGLTRPYFILSFDCDTVQDIEVVAGVHARLQDMGITPVYAVPGQLLEKGQSVYRQIANTGAEFINHGYTEHCHYDSESEIYISSFFYDQLPSAVVKNDILQGHETQIRILGRHPKGFRVPHFGTFQDDEHLTFLFDALIELGYQYSTSTLPLFGFCNGPAKKVANEFYEIPVSGCFDYPLTILDSWSFRFAPNRRVTESDYINQFSKMAQMIRKGNALLNVYADPSQIYNWEGFFESMASVSEFAIGSYSDFLGEIN